MTQTTQTKQYFNLTADGVGFVNRIRVVQGKGKSSPYFACVIQASHGEDGDKSRFDVRVVGNEAKEIFQRLVDEYPDVLSSDYRQHPTVSIAFRVSDLTPKLIEFKDKKTQEDISIPTIDARLLIVKSLKVNGELFHRSEAENKDSQQESASSEEDEQTKYGDHRQ